jgi:pyrroline-5-carboxylate reductase
MFVYFTDAVTKSRMAVNPKQVVAVLNSPNTEQVPGKTIISTAAGTLAIDEDILDVVGTLNGVLNHD